MVPYQDVRFWRISMMISYRLILIDDIHVGIQGRKVHREKSKISILHGSYMHLGAD